MLEPEKKNIESMSTCSANGRFIISTGNKLKYFIEEHKRYHQWDEKTVKYFTYLKVIKETITLATKGSVYGIVDNAQLLRLKA